MGSGVGTGDGVGSGVGSGKGLGSVGTGGTGNAVVSEVGTGVGVGTGDGAAVGVGVDAEVDAELDVRPRRCPVATRRGARPRPGRALPREGEEWERAFSGSRAGVAGAGDRGGEAEDEECTQGDCDAGDPRRCTQRSSESPSVAGDATERDIWSRIGPGSGAS